MFSRAEAYERFMGRWSGLVAPLLADFSEVSEGDAVLDVGSGTGALALALRAANGTGRITGVDPSDDYVRYAASKSDDPSVVFEVGDARELRFPSSTFDKTVSAFALNFVPEPERAVKEMARVTRPGGVVTAAVWDYADGMQMLRTFWDEARALDPDIAPRDEAHMPLSGRGELLAAWRRHGLLHVEEAALTVPLHFASFDDYWAPFLLGQGPAGAHVVALSTDRQRALEERLRKRLASDGSDRPIDMHARAWAVKGRAPQS
jgi:SAM-dependent methyltransferase